MKKQIVSRWYSNKILFEFEVPETHSGIALRYALEKATLSGADLSDADLRDADLSDADLRGADLSGADLSDADLSGANLCGANLRDADLSDADLRDADLSDADLRGADLCGADLCGADLCGADLRGADLRGADLSGADLSDADLSGADLSDADLSDADLSGADLSDADGQQLPRATPEQAIENLDKVREILLDDETRLNMGHWHGADNWKQKTCAEETLCGTTHCLAGWLQVCTTETSLKNVNAQLAGVLAAPIASKMFFKDGVTALDWLRDRKYVAESAEVERRNKERKANHEAAEAAS